MNSESGEKRSKSCGGGRPKKKGGNISKYNKITVNKTVAATADSTSTIETYVCGIALGFQECIMRICFFFANIQPARPMEVDLTKIATKSRTIFQQIDISFFNDEKWYITFEGKKVEGYGITEKHGINKQSDSFILEMFVEKETICDNLNYWFSMEQHKFTILKCESKVIGLLKFEEKYYVYDPNNEMLTINGETTCQLTECYNTVQLEEVIRECLAQQDLTKCTVMCHLIAITITWANTTPITHSARRLDEGNSRKAKIGEPGIKNCGSSAKKCEDDSESDCNMIIKGTCPVSYNKHSLFMYVCSFFWLIDVNKPNQIKLDSVVAMGRLFITQWPTSYIDQFDVLNFVYKRKHILIYKIFGYNKFNGELYESFNFVMFCDKAVLVNNLNKWFAMGYHEKSVFQCLGKVFGILISGKKYYIFDPNECFSDRKDDTAGEATLTLTECGDTEELAAILYDSLNSKSLVHKSFICTVFAVNTLLPIEGSDLYVTTEPPTYERSQKVKGVMQISILLSKENEIRLEEQHKKLRDYKAKRLEDMSEAEREDVRKYHREYSSRRWEDMSEAEKQDLLKRHKEYKSKRLEDMSEAEKEDVRKYHREYSSRRWEDMSEAEKQDLLKRHKEYKSKRLEDMSEAEKEDVRKYHREYSSRRWEDMSEAEKQDLLKRHKEYKSKRLEDMSEAEKEDVRKYHREYSSRRWEDMSEAEKQDLLKRHKEYKSKRLEDMSEAEKEDVRKYHREYSSRRWEDMSEAEKQDLLKRHKEYKSKRLEDMSEAEKEDVRKYHREYSSRRWEDMSEAEREDVRKYHREYSARTSEGMDEEEKEERNKKNRDNESSRVAAMNAQERGEYRKKHREYEAEKRKSMTAEEKAAAKSKAKERYKKNDKEIAEKLALTTSLKKQFKVKVKKGELKDNVVAALGGGPEHYIVGQTLVNSSLQQREEWLNKQSRSLVTLVYSLKHRKANCDAKENIEEKYVTMLGTSLHTKHSEAYFPDTTYKSMPGNTYALDENGLLVVNTGEGVGDTFRTNENCDIDVGVVYARLYTIIEVVLKSTETQLISFIDNIDKCDNRARADVEKLGHPKECYVHNGNNYGCSSVLLFLRSVSPHYPFMRNIVSRVYKVRKELRMFREVDAAINTVNVDELKLICDGLRESSQTNGVSRIDWPYANENSISTKYLAAFTTLQRKSEDLPKTVCISCMELCFENKVRHIQDFYPTNRTLCGVWDDLLDEHEKHEYKYGKFICTYCYDKFNTEKKVPPTCLLNKLQVREAPVCITRLNTYEQMLIQRAKAFQVVTRMGSVSKKNRPRHEMIEKVIGRTFHLPIPLEETLRKMPRPYQAIAPNQDLYILVRGLPSKQKQIFQSFVNVNHVYEALQWLQAHNPLYNQIVLPASAANILDELENEDDVQFDLGDIRTQTEESASTPPAMLTPKDVTDSFYEEVTFHSIGIERPNEQPSTVYQFKKVFDKPIDNREIELDIKCFPHLFCYGENGQFAERTYQLPLRQFMKNRVQSVHAEFRLNIQYLFFLLNIINMRQIAASIYTAMNITPQIQNMTAKMLREKMAKNEFDKNASSIFTSLRNSKAFWNRPRNDINCMVRHYGVATFFLTISPSEYHWISLEKYLREINGQRAVGKTASALIAMDPISTSRYIDNKFKAMLAFICSEDNPIGEVEHYAWRREYQSRGLQHFHLMVWIKGAPILGESSDEEVANFISTYVTCHIPDKRAFPTLYSRVMSYQQHYHNSYCMRTKKTKQGRFIKRCRFTFPRPITENITLRDVATSIHGRRKLKLKSRLYDLRRNKAEVNINDYNPAILLAWEGNMDIQFIGEKTGALCAYITKYNTKPEKSLVGDGFSDIVDTKPLYSKLWSMGLRILNNREAGTLEAADTLLENSLFGTDKDTTIKWLDVRKARNRKLRDWKQMENLSDDSTDLYWPSIIDVHYPNRPDGLKDVCLYDFARKYDIGKERPKREIEFYVYGKLFVKRRAKECLINHYNFDMETHSEEYFRALLLLYKPFRNESELLGTFKTFVESFDNCKDDLVNALQYHDKLQAIARAKKALDERVKDIEDASQEAADRDANVYGSQNAVGIDQAILDMPAFFGIDNISDNDLRQMVETLHVDQSRVFSTVTETLLQQNAGTNTKPIRMHIAGVGGSGKSHLIKVLQQWVKNVLAADVLIAAPTGIAAQNIKGVTIHRLLKLPVEHGSTPQYTQLNDANLQQLRNEFRNVKLLIIDEISMVSNIVLLFMHLRLQELYNSYQMEDGWFGGINILFFGDLLQLPPVREHFPFVTLLAAQLTKVHGSVPCDINLWVDIFSYDELTINVRQQTDTSYANILSRIRLGIIDENDQEELDGRLLHFSPKKNQEYYLKEVVQQLQKLPPTCVCLFPRKQQCAELNAGMLALVAGPEIILKANDEFESRSIVQRKKAIEYLKTLAENSNNTAALEDTVAIKIGCKVMLRRNISSTLVNGSIGIVQEIIKDAMDDSVSKIKILFGEEEHLLERLKVKFQVFQNLYVVRSQFPITLAYAITIHKSQSLSLECCLMDIGNFIFCEGQTYVALSRLTTLNGVYLVNYDAQKVLVNQAAIQEYNRLRSKYRPDLKQIEISVNNSSSRSDVLWWKRGHIGLDPVDDIERRSGRGGQLPGFQNLNNNCFANSTLQCLLSITSINNNIMLSQDSPFKRIAVEYNNPFKAVLNSDEIIRHLGFPLGQMQDVTEFIAVLIRAFPHIINEIQFLTEEIRTCTRCSHSYTFEFAEDNRKHHLDEIFKISIPNDAETSALLQQTARSNKTKSLTMNDFLRYAYAPEHLDGAPCPVCAVPNVSTRSITIKEAGNVVILALNIFTHLGNRGNLVQRQKLKVSGAPASILEIAGSRYQLKASIFHHGVDQQLAHYTSYIRFDKGWNLANDTNITAPGWPKLSQKMYVLFYEKITR